MRADRRLTLVGLRIVGLWLVVHAILTFASGLITGGAGLYGFSQMAAKEATFQADSTPDEAKARELDSEFRMRRIFRRETYRHQAMQGISKAIWAVLCILTRAVKEL